VQKAHAEGAFFGMVTLPDGDKTFASFYGKDGLRKHLTEIADVIGPRILTLKLGQFDALFVGPAREPPTPPSPSQGEKDAERLVEGRTFHLLTHGERILGVFTDGIDYHYPNLPTVLFGERPIFGWGESADTARRCSSCGRDVVYFDAVVEEDKLIGYACPHCTACPTQAWDGGRIPAERGTAVDDHDVFLQIYLGYQYCPFTRLRLPWSDDIPRMEVIKRRVKGVVYLTAATVRCLPCRSELSYRYGNLEFLIVHRDTRRFLRGSGLLVHLIRDHRFFEGEESPFRLDPERAAHVLGLSP
jgi:hypothetical protein